jgi:hypothetical protein
MMNLITAGIAKSSVSLNSRAFVCETVGGNHALQNL